MQPTTVPTTEGEIPIWLWWLLPVIPFFGLWVNLQLKAQRSKSPVNKQEDPISVPLSTKPDVTGAQPQKNSAQLDFNSLTEPLKTQFSSNIDHQFIEPLKTPFSPAVTTVSLPRTIIQKRHQTETVQLENNLQPQGSSISLIASEVDKLDSAIAIPPQESILLENQVEIQPEGEFFITAKSPDSEFYPVRNGEIKEVSEVVLIKEIDPDEAEAVIAEFLTTKAQIENISVSEIVEPEPDIQNESIIWEPDIAETEPIVVTVEEQLTEPEISVSEIVEPEPDIQNESIIWEPDIAETEQIVVTVEEQLTEPEISVSEIVKPEPDIQNESIIWEPDITETEPIVVTVDEQLTEPEISVSEIVEPEPDIQNESIILEPDIAETESIVVTVEEQLTEPEISVSEIVESEPDIQNESIIWEPDIAETEPTFFTVEEQLTEPEISVSEIVESEPEIQNESIIWEPDIAETEPIVVPVDEQLTEPEISVSEIVKPETEEIELGVPHQQVRSETDVAATKFNVGKEIKFEPSLADVDQETSTITRWIWSKSDFSVTP